METQIEVIEAMERKMEKKKKSKHYDIEKIQHLLEFSSIIEEKCIFNSSLSGTEMWKQVEDPILLTCDWYCMLALRGTHLGK